MTAAPAPGVPTDRSSCVPLGSVEELVDLLGEPTELVRTKFRSALTVDDVAWLQASSFCFVATADAEGRCDASPKGDPPGRLVHVIDERTIALAERPGNRLADGHRNILANPHIGMDFVVSGRNDTLRNNGRASLVPDAPFFDELVVQGHRPVLAVVVDIEQVYAHCARALLRGRVWEPDTWRPAREPRPAYEKDLYVG